MSASYTHFTTEERESLLKMQTLGYGIRCMALVLARSPSSISRELKRNAGPKGYSPSRARTLYQRRRRRCIRRKRLSDPVLKEYVVAALRDFWSPEQIDGRLKLERGHPVISYSTIYRAMKRRELGVPKSCFRRKRRSPAPHEKETRGRISDYRHIEELPRAAVTASQFGHWEGDTVRGGQGKGAVASFVDRRSKFLVAALLPDRKAQSLNAAMFAAFAKLPVRLCKTFLFDHGNEFFSFGGLSSEVQHRIKKDFIRSFPVEAFSRAKIEFCNETLNVLVGNMGAIPVFWQKLAKQAVGVFIGRTLPWGVRVCEKDAVTELIA